MLAKDDERTTWYSIPWAIDDESDVSIDTVTLTLSDDDDPGCEKTSARTTFGAYRLGYRVLALASLPPLATDAPAQQNIAFSAAVLASTA